MNAVSLPAVSLPGVSSRPSMRRPVVATVAMAVGCASLLARPVLSRYVDDPTAAIAALFIVMLAVGLAWPVGESGARPMEGLAQTAAVFAAGVAAFATGRVLGGLPGVAAVST